MSFNLPEPIIYTLLDKLAHDDDFRDIFSKQPRAALAQLGYGPAADMSQAAGIWDCWKVRSLASKESIVAARSALRAQFSSSSFAQLPFMLDSTVNPRTGRVEDDRQAA